MLAISIISGSYIFILVLLSFLKTDYEFLIITLFILISPVPLLAYTHAWLIKYYFYITYLILIIISLFNFFSIDKPRKPSFYKIINPIIFKYDIKSFIISNNFKLVILSAFFTLIFTYTIFPTFWRFESTELLYYSWLNDINNIDYRGPIRIPTAYPYLQAANHLTPGSLLLPFQLFQKNINLYTSYIVKYILVAFTLFKFQINYFKSFIGKDKLFRLKNLFLPIILICFLYFLYFNEIEYSIAISNYPLVIIILCLGIITLKSNNLNSVPSFNLAIIYIGYAFLITKATTFPIILLSFIFYLLTIGVANIKKFFNSFNSVHIIGVVFMTAINVLSWIIPQSNHGSLHLAFPFCSFEINNQRLIKECFLSIFNNPFSGWYIESAKTDLLKILKINQPFLEFIFIWFFCLTPCLFSGNMLIKTLKKSTNINIGRYIICYLLSTSLCVVFKRIKLFFRSAYSAFLYSRPDIFIIRNINHICFKFKKSKLDNLKIILILFLTIILFIKNIDNSIVNKRSKSLLKAHIADSGGIISMTYNESKYFDEKTCSKNKNIEEKFGYFLDSQGCAYDSLGEINTSLKGIRSDVTLNSRFSVLRGWVLNFQ